MHFLFNYFLPFLQEGNYSKLQRTLFTVNSGGQRNNFLIPEKVKNNSTVGHRKKEVVFLFKSSLKPKDKMAVNPALTSISVKA